MTKPVVKRKPTRKKKPLSTQKTTRDLDFEVVRGGSAVIATLEEFRTQSSTSKTELAQRSSLHREAIARLLSPDNTNPTFRSIAKLLASLGLRMEITICEADQKQDKYLFEVSGDFQGQRRVAGKDF